MKRLNIAMIGSGFMGKAHSLAYSAMPLYFNPAPALPVRKVLADVTPEIAAAAAERLQFEESSGDWREVVSRDDIDVVDICTPNDSHAEIAIAAAKAGKHIICEKPLARDAAEAKRMLDAVEAAGVTHMVAYNYRHTPAVEQAKRLVDDGRLGEILTFRGHYQQDWSADPGTPLSWRFSKQASGSGTLGDIGTHIIDMGRYILGEISDVNALVRTFVPERPKQTGSFDKMGAGDHAASGERGPVDVDDYIQTLLKFESGVIGSIESSRNSWGRHNWLGFEIQGTRGTVIFDYQRMNELRVMFADDPADVAGFRTIYSGPAHPYGENLWPVPCLGLGYTEIKLIECFNFFKAIEEGRPGNPSFRDGYEIARIADAILESGRTEAWTPVRPNAATGQAKRAEREDA